MKDDSILIVGTGALATLFAARLAAAGISVTMLGTWLAGLTALRQGGAELDGRAHHLVVTDQASNCKGSRDALVLVKTWQTERAASQLEMCLASDGLVLSLQNGIGNADILTDRLGKERVATGVTTLGANLTAPGRAVSGGEGAITLEAHPRLGRMEEMLRRAGFQLRIVTDVRALVWGKLAVNAAINPLTALLGMRNGELLGMPSIEHLMDALTGEAEEVAGALGVSLEPPGAARAAREVAKRTAENCSSMLQDVLRQAPTEVDAINGAILREGMRLGIPTPINKAIWQLMRELVGK